MAPAIEPTKIAGYRIEGVLGTGGMSRVYVARQISLDRRVALKVFELGAGGQGALRLRREAHLLARLDHENVVRCIDFGEADGYFYLALELVDGESLKQRLDRVGRLSGPDAARIAHAVGIALQHAHAKGVVHRDVKPGNVLLSRDGKVKLSDFGLAKTPEDAEITQPGTALGTPQYLSPEQARSPRRANAQSDVYSLGATLYHMVSGVPPYQGDTLAEVITAILFDPVHPPEAIEPNLDPGLSRIIARAMAKERTLRYRSALELDADLFRWLAGQADTSVGISWAEAGAPAREPVPRRAWLIGAATAIASSILVAFLIHGYFTDEPEPPTYDPKPVLSISEVTSGTVSPVAAYRAFVALEEGRLDPEFQRELLAEVERRSRDLADAAAAAAELEIVAGRFDNAFTAFERDARTRVESTLGAQLDALPEPIAKIHADALAVARTRIESVLTSCRSLVDDALDAELKRRVEGIASLLASFRVVAAAAEIENLSRDAESTVRSTFERGISRSLRGATANPDPGWVAARTDSWARAAREASRDLEARLAEAVTTARTAVSGADLDPLDDRPIDALRGELLREVGTALGAGADEVRSQAPEIDLAVAARLETLERLRDERRAHERARAEASRAIAVATALENGDVVAARRELGEADPAEIGDPWLRTLAYGVEAIDAAQRAALLELESERGKRVRVATSGVNKEGVLERVESTSRRLVFTDPRFEVRIAEFSNEELERRAGAAATPVVRALTRALRGDLPGARAAMAGCESEPWFAGLAATLDAREVEREAATRDEAEAVRAALTEYVRAYEAGERGRAAALAEEILSNPVSLRLAEVKLRRPELERVRKEGRLEAERDRKRERVTSSTKARVDFLEDGRVRLLHRFDDLAELSDFELPGSEWRLVDGRLSSLALLDRSDLGTRIDLFRNRPGIERALPFELTSTKPIRVEFELVLPLDPRPGLFGIRVMSTCFVLRTFSDREAGGQVNGWQGELDEYRDYLFDPALGETRPKKSGGGWRPYALERGNRYRCVVEGSAGEGAEWSLTIEGDVVHRFRIDKPPRGDSIELRTEMPCEFDELILEGSIAGVR